MSNDKVSASLMVGDATIHFSIPTSLRDAISRNFGGQKIDIIDDIPEIEHYSWENKHIIEILRSLLPRDKRPPTLKQERYAKAIASTLDIQLDDDVLLYAEKCSEFLETYSPRYQEIVDADKSKKLEIKQMASQANRVDRWLKASALLEGGISPEEAAKAMGVTAPTIDKYVTLLKEWEQEAKANGTHDVVLDLVEMQRNGTNIYLLKELPC